MNANCSKKVIDQKSNMSSSQKSVVFLSALLFDTNSSSEVLIRDDVLQCSRYLRIKQFKIGETTSFN